ncbi:MAG: hypothetical protein ABI612_14260 [Betaproteobacteria bacterium]
MCGIVGQPGDIKVGDVVELSDVGVRGPEAASTHEKARLPGLFFV